MAKNPAYWMRRACPLLIAALLAGCDPAGSTYPAKPCYPVDAGLMTTPQPVGAGKDDPGPIDLYFDASESMAGYIRGSQDKDDKPLQDLVSLTVGPSAQLGTHVRAFLFGADIHAVAPEKIVQLASIDPYICNPRRDADCDNQQTHIDAVLNAIAGSPKDRLSVIVTDLWLSNRDLISSRELALGMPIRRIFAGGRSVIVMGVQAPYNGKIYDLPGGVAAPQWNRDRPLFLLLVGPYGRVEQFRNLLMRQQSPSFAPALVHSSVFTAESPPDVQPPKLSGRMSDALSARLVLDPRYLLTAQQLDLHPAEAIKSRNAQAGLSAVVRTDTTIPRDWVWRGQLAAKARLWMLVDPSALAVCNARGKPAWRPMGVVANAWSVTSPDQATLTINPADNAFTRLPPGRTYLMVATLNRGPMQHPNPATQWLRDWSFEDVETPALLARPRDVFPTYKLKETAAVLETGLEDSERSDGRPLTTVPVLIRVTR